MPLSADKTGRLHHVVFFPWRLTLVSPCLRKTLNSGSTLVAVHTILAASPRIRTSSVGSSSTYGGPEGTEARNTTREHLDLLALCPTPWDQVTLVSSSQLVSWSESHPTHLTPLALERNEWLKEERGLSLSSPHPWLPALLPASMPRQAFFILQTFVHFKSDADGEGFLSIHHSLALIVIAVNKLHLVDDEPLPRGEGIGCFA